MSQELQCKTQTWWSTEGNGTTRTEAAKHAAALFTTEVLTMKGEIAALEEERTYIYYLLEH